jgi:hypothetical protein
MFNRIVSRSIPVSAAAVGVAAVSFLLAQYLSALIATVAGLIYQPSPK